MSWLELGVCSSAVGFAITSVILGIIAIVLFVLIITIPFALAFFAASIICGIIAIAMAIKLLYKPGFSGLSLYCKIMIVLCFVIIIGEIVAISVQSKHVTNAVTPAPTMPPTESPTDAPVTAPTTL